MKINQTGQTLVEVIVASGIVTLVLSGLVSAITYGLASVQFSKNKALATKYAQDAVEWIRSERDTAANWSTFYTTRSNHPTGRLYCLFTLNWNEVAEGDPCAPIDDTYDKFVRMARITGNGSTSPNDSDRVYVNVEVTWYEGRRQSRVNLRTFLTNW